MQLMLTTVADSENPVVGDLDLRDGQLWFSNDGITAEDDRAIAQEIRCSFRFFKGEWFLDTREGVPYFESVLVKGPRLNLIRSMFRNLILRCQRIETVVSIALNLRSDRQLEVSWIARKVGGGTLRSVSFAPFIIEF